MGEVDPAFFQAPEHRPLPETVEADGIPLIDLRHVILQEPQPGALEDTVALIGKACREWGFFQIINHGIPTDLRHGIESFSRTFYSLPKEEKKKVYRDEAKPLGYYDTEHTKNVRDWKEVFDFASVEPMILPDSPDPGDSNLKEIFNQWPENLPGMRETCMEYSREMEKLAFKLLEFIALSLGLKADRFKEFFTDHTSFIRLNHYPPCPVPDLALGVGRHKDAGVLTILAQDDVGGLQVKRKTDGQWILVKPVPDSYIINVGDIIQVWSNDRYESVEHRVKVNSEKERFSIPYFFNAGYNTMVKPLEELVDEHNPPNYNAYNWGKFFSARKRSNFKKLAEENVQIYHFRTS